MDDIKQDIRFLAHQLDDRLAHTDEEERAANYVRDRLAPFVSHAEVREFSAVGNERLLPAIFCAEFATVALAAFWWPKLAFFYGLWVFLAHMAEAIGIPVYAHFLPHYSSWSVVGLREPTSVPLTHIVFTAYLDSDDTPFPRLDAFFARLGVHRLIAVCMVVTLAVCGVTAWGSMHGYDNPVAHGIHVGACALFSALAVACLLRALLSNPSAGANRNASGVAALLNLAERLQQRSLKQAHVSFCFAGSHFSYMGGMRHFLKTESFAKENTFFVNVENVGNGQLFYSLAEGLLRRVACCPTMIETASSREKRYQAKPAVLPGWRTGAWLPLMRGFKAISILRLGEDGLPMPLTADEDLWEEVDSGQVKQAARLAESIARHVAKTRAETEIPF